MATIDLTLNSFLIPNLVGYQQPFGTKVIQNNENYGGLSTAQVNNNIMMPFAKMRAITVNENSQTTRIEFDAKLMIPDSVTNPIKLTLNNGGYAGCTCVVINNSSSILTVVTGDVNNNVPSNCVFVFVWDNKKWNVLQNNLMLSIVF